MTREAGGSITGMSLASGGGGAGVIPVTAPTSIVGDVSHTSHKYTPTRPARRAQLQQVRPYPCPILPARPLTAGLSRLLFNFYILRLARPASYGGQTKHFGGSRVETRFRLETAWNLHRSGSFFKRDSFQRRFARFFDFLSPSCLVSALPCFLPLIPSTPPSHSLPPSLSLPCLLAIMVLSLLSHSHPFHSLHSLLASLLAEHGVATGVCRRLHGGDLRVGHHPLLLHQHRGHPPGGGQAHGRVSMSSSGWLLLLRLLLVSCWFLSCCDSLPRERCLLMFAQVRRTRVFAQCAQVRPTSPPASNWLSFLQFTTVGGDCFLGIFQVEP